MKSQIIIFTVVLAILIPTGAMSMKEMDHGSMSSGEMDHSKMKGHDSGMSGMDMGGSMIMLKNQEMDGVMGSAHLMDVKEKMAEHGMTVTHHMMVGFMNNEGKGIDNGQVAVKVQSPEGNVAKPVKMMGMAGQFGADITLDQKGKYLFIVGTKLADGKKRTFKFDYENN